jgi:sugar/nucleoside kinase (ribokinase family)
MSFDVFGMCNAIYDIVAELDEARLAELGVAKGSMQLVDDAQQQELAPKILPHVVHSESGGSGANTMFGVALLGGTACYTSRVGRDEHGPLYHQGLSSRGVKPNLGVSDGATGLCLVLITPDAERTMCTSLGCARNLAPEDVNLEDLRASKYLYVTGYLWDMPNQKEAVLHAMRAANEAGVKVAFSLADPFCVNRHRGDFLHLLQHHIDVVIGNEVEAKALTGRDDVREAARELARHADLAVVTMDKDGSLIQRGEETVEIPVCEVRAVDTTGAGDMFAAGILYGLTHGLPLSVTGNIASYAAAQVVAKLGPRLESIDQDVIARLKAGKHWLVEG